MIKSSRGYVAITAFAVIFGAFLLWRNFSNKKAVANDRAYSVAHVYDYTPTGKGIGGSLSYYYLVNGERYTSSRHYTRITLRGASHFLNREFPVIYDNSVPARNYILVLPEDFSDFGLGFPDSLQWAVKFAEY